MKRFLTLGLIVLVYSITLFPVNAQSDPCSLPTLLQSFEAAGLSGNVQTWLDRYQGSDCPQNIKSAVSAMARGYALATNTDISGGSAGISVDAASWTSTGMLLEVGQLVTISATGSIHPNVRNPNETLASPIGVSSCNSVDCPLMNAPAYALVARVGEGEPFFVGDQLSFTTTIAGELQFIVNDTIHWDNAGAYLVEVTVEG